MEKKYINEDRYKKTAARKRRNTSTVRSNLKSKKQVEIPRKTQTSKKVKTTVKSKSKPQKRRKENKGMNIVICIILLISIAILSRAILKDENEPFIYLPFMQKANEDVIKIGVITSDSLLDNNTTNLIINELNKYSSNMLLEINDDYSIQYKCIEQVKKISNKEYLLVKNTESKVDINKIKQELDNYRSDVKSIYYSKLNNISNILISDDKTLKVTLKEEDAYFIYNLEICLKDSEDKTGYIKDKNSSDNKLILTRHSKANKELPAKIVVTRYSDMYKATEAYKSNVIDIFITDAENVQNILGKHEYKITTFRNGNSVFLLGNPKSNIYSLKAVRQAIAYSIDRDAIIKGVLKSKGEKIDLPYIYDNVKYKYDVYAAENILLSNKYTKKNKVYSKTENGKKITLELDLVVNKQDEIKVNIAEHIKNNLNAIGIKINVEKLSQAKIVERIKKGSYDLCLANVYLNNNPNLSFISENLYITEEINLVQNIVLNSKVEEVSKNITELRDILSQDISIIGICSDVSYVVYRKDILGIEKNSYMNIFKGIFSKI